MKKALIVLIVLGAAGGGYAYYKLRETPPEPVVATAAVSRGAVVEAVGATGTLQAVTTVQVGTQVSGVIQELYADFNTLVRKGQVIARLDPSTIQTQIEQARANLARAEADLERLRVSADDARNKLKRARELSAKRLIPETELEAAEVSVRSAEAQVRSAEASITQSRASLRQNEVNLAHTVIAAPIDGLVISRNVDRGQTVAASMQAPTLFVLAADLTKMQVVANLDESDVGRIRPGQHVTFRVDAYPADEFVGTVSQVRLQPIVQQNVVTYATVIDVPNPELKLKPGMTANVNVEIVRRDDVVRVPNAALRFRPTNEIFAALGQTPPQPLQRGDPGGGGRGLSGAPEATPPAASSASAPPAASSAGRRSTGTEPPSVGSARGAAPDGEGTVRSGNRGRALAERLQGLSAEDRERTLERMRARGLDPSTLGDRPEGGGASGRGANQPRTPSQAAPTGALANRAAGATTIDALFGPLPVIETRGRAWVLTDKKLEPIPLRLGVSDGQYTELLEGHLEPGIELVTSVTIGGEARPAPQSFAPFLGPGRGFGGGNRGGGAGGARGGR